MGSVLQERVPQPQLCVEGRARIGATAESCRRKKSNNRPHDPSNKMGRRHQSQRKSVQPQYTFPSQENNNEKRMQQRRKHKPHPPQTKRNTCQHSAQGTLESNSQPPTSAEARMEPKVQPSAQRSGRREKKPTGIGGSRHTPAFPCHRLSDSSPDLLERVLPKPEVGLLSGRGDGDSDSDLSESERLPALPSGRVPPQLELRPDVPEAEDCSARRPTRQGCRGFDFPDFLPPPFNSWSLSQLALFYNMEGLGASRPRPVGCLERYLERLLQLEWCQIQTSQEESGKSTVSDVTSGCHRSPAAASARLSSPKCILQCQRSFPLTFLSCLASHSTLLSGCACSLCRIRLSTCHMPCCRSTHCHTRPSRLSPTLEHRGAASLPKRSYSESRVHSSDRNVVSPAQRLSSPVRANSHLRRMQASGNIRNPAQGANTKPHANTRDPSVGARGDALDYRTGGCRKRSDSEQRRVGGVERRQNGWEKRRSGSESRRGGTERRGTSELREQEVKPDAVTAIMDNLPGSKFPPVHRLNKPKQVEFVT